MQTYTFQQKSYAFVVSGALLVFGLVLSYWLWANNWQNATEVIRLRFADFGGMVQSMGAWDYFGLMIGLVVLQETSMLFSRYCLGLQGKKERIYVKWHGKEFGLHHLHWGIVIMLIGLIGQLAGVSTNLFLIAVGFSCVVSDFFHHGLLEWLHGDPEGDGPLRSPFKRS